MTRYCKTPRHDVCWDWKLTTGTKMKFYWIWMSKFGLNCGCDAADGPSLVLGAQEWPAGCLGYAFNLVRPVLQGHRADLLYPCLGSSLVGQPPPPPARAQQTWFLKFQYLSPTGPGYL